MTLQRSTRWFETSTSRRRQLRSSERLPGEDGREENRCFPWYSIRPAADRQPSLPTPGAAACAQGYISGVRRHGAAGGLLPDTIGSSPSQSEQNKRGLSLPQHLETTRQSQQSSYGKL